MEIKKKDIVRIERLARLKLSPEQEEGFSERLTKVFDWIDHLAEVNTEGVHPMVNPLTTLNIPTTPLRQDQVTDGERQEEILSNAPKAQHGSFTVPKVVE